MAAASSALPAVAWRRVCASNRPSSRKTRGNAFVSAAAPAARPALGVASHAPAQAASHTATPTTATFSRGPADRNSDPPRHGNRCRQGARFRFGHVRFMIHLVLAEDVLSETYGGKLQAAEVQRRGVETQPQDAPVVYSAKPVFAPPPDMACQITRMIRRSSKQQHNQYKPFEFPGVADDRVFYSMLRLLTKPETTNRRQILEGRNFSAERKPAWRLQQRHVTLSDV